MEDSMNKTNIFKSLLLVMFAFLFFNIAGCSKPPAQEMANAEKAVDEAKQKEANIYVPDVFKKADDSLKNATQLVINKNYKEAKKIAEETIQISQQAIAMVEQNKAKMKDETEHLIEEFQKNLDEFKILSAKALKKKVISSEDIHKDIGKMEIDIINIKEKLQNQLVKQAYDDVKDIGGRLEVYKQTVDAGMITKKK
jgi:methionine synthase II (cobalamin-independent)